MADATLLIKYRDQKVADLYAGYSSNLTGDAGFDLHCPEDVKFAPKETKIVPLGVFTAMTRVDDSKSEDMIEYVNQHVMYLWIAIFAIFIMLYDFAAGVILGGIGLYMTMRFWSEMHNGDYPAGMREAELGCDDKFVSYRIYPRSSISKTPLRLANSVGVVDSGYRGEIMAALDNISDSEYTLSRGTRLVQLVCDTGNIVNITEVESFTQTERGARGFGSTGAN